jgi:ceramide glucosyltransferase
MIRQIPQAIEIVAVLGTASSIFYYLLCLWSGARFLRERGLAGKSVLATPAVSILKPLKGTDPEMYESFRSHCRQDYPEYEIIFGVSDPADPAAELVKRLKAEFPDRSIVLQVCAKNLGANAKVSSLAQMLRDARYEHLIVSDSDIRVEPDYLQRVVAPLVDPKIGLITCLYRGVPAPTLGSRLESLGISTEFVPGVLAARQLEGGIRFGLGSTLAFRRRDLAAIGGFEAFADYLADDYELGRRIAGLGLKVELSEVVVETFLPAYSFPEFVRHQLRWARTIRSARRGGYTGLLLTFGLFWSLVAIFASRGAGWAWALLGLAACTRLIMALVVGRGVLGDSQVLRWLWLLPLRDLVAVATWVGGLVGHTISWRGEKFRLRDGKLTPLARV